MAMSRKRWNNVIIIVALLMIAILNLINNKTAHLPDQAHALFDDKTSLSQLQLNGIWLARQGHQWQCEQRVLNCDNWAQAWQQIHVSLLEQDVGTEQTLDAQRLSIKVTGVAEAQHWLLFNKTGRLKSPSGHWYQIPPSERSQLQPILSVAPTQP